MLALQGDFREHRLALEAAGADPVSVRRPPDLEGLHAIVLPGGESTTMQLLLERVGLWEPLRERVRAGLPTLATCAGLILLAARVEDGRAGQRSFGLLDVVVRRNAYGSQLESFEAALEVDGLDDSFEGIFIRAPQIESVGSAANAYAWHGEWPVGVRQGAIIGLAFHPELAEDTRIHREFVRIADGRPL